MSEHLDVLLAFAIIALMCFLLLKMHRFDKHMDDVRENGQFAPMVFHQESSYTKYRRERRRMDKYSTAPLNLHKCHIHLDKRWRYVPNQS